MEDKAYINQLKFYIKKCKYPDHEELKKMDLMRWSDKELNKMSKEEIFLLINTVKTPCFNNETTKRIEYILNTSSEKYGKESIFKYINLFMYGLMLGKAWSRSKSKY